MKKIIGIMVLTALFVVLPTGCAAESASSPVNAQLRDIVLPADESGITSSAEATVSESDLAISYTSSSSSTTSSSSSSARAPYSRPRALPAERKENGNVMYVTRQKYGKKAPRADAERSRFYTPLQEVTVVKKTATGYYLLDNGDYINCDYVSHIPSADVDDKVDVMPAEAPKTVGGSGGYNRTAALKYAAEHWDKDECLCAEFASECLTAGGLKYDLASSTSLYNALCSSNLGYSVRIGLNGDGAAEAPDCVKAGDIIFYYCAAENKTVHTAVCSGKTEDGLLRAFAHNPRDNGEEALVYEEQCTGGCGYPLNEIFVFCFYSK